MSRRYDRNISEGVIDMQKITKVSVVNGSMRKEFNCDFFVALAITEKPDEHACEHLIVGVTGTDGILSAIRTLKNLENDLYDALPFPKELVQLQLAMEESLQKSGGKKVTDERRDSGQSYDPLLSTLMHENWDGENNPLKKLIERINRPESKGR